jgi:hypothetical protein
MSDDGSGETFALKQITDLMAQIREEYPGIHFQIYSGNAEEVAERLEKGCWISGCLWSRQIYRGITASAYRSWIPGA